MCTPSRKAAIAKLKTPAMLIHKLSPKEKEKCESASANPKPCECRQPLPSTWVMQIQWSSLVTYLYTQAHGLQYLHTVGNIPTYIPIPAEPIALARKLSQHASFQAAPAAHPMARIATPMVSCRMTCSKREAFWMR